MTWKNGEQSQFRHLPCGRSTANLSCVKQVVGHGTTKAPVRSAPLIRFTSTILVVLGQLGEEDGTDLDSTGSSFWIDSDTV